MKCLLLGDVSVICGADSCCITEEKIKQKKKMLGGSTHVGGHQVIKVKTAMAILRQKIHDNKNDCSSCVTFKLSPPCFTATIFIQCFTFVSEHSADGPTQKSPPSQRHSFRSFVACRLAVWRIPVSIFASFAFNGCGSFRSPTMKPALDGGIRL